MWAFRRSRDVNDEGINRFNDISIDNESSCSIDRCASKRNDLPLSGKSLRQRKRVKTHLTQFLRKFRHSERDEPRFSDASEAKVVLLHLWNGIARPRKSSTEKKFDYKSYDPFSDLIDSDGDVIEGYECHPDLHEPRWHERMLVQFRKLCSCFCDEGQE